MDESQKDVNAEQKILAAAEIEFLETGFAGARMQRIADRAGMNKALLHYYFRSKDKLFELVFNWKLNQFVPQVNEVLFDESVPFLEKIDRFVFTYLTMLRRNPNLPMLIISTLHRNPEFAKRITHTIGTDFAKVMHQEVATGKIKSVDVHQFWISVMGMCIFPFVSRPMVSHLFKLSEADFDRLIAERHIHVMQYARAILSV
jgi:TetR/AcrR family transcriptional regulator